MNSQWSDLPVYRCTRIDREINLSRKIDDPVWKTAQVIKLVDNMTGGSPEQFTEVRLLYSSLSTVRMIIYGVLLKSGIPLFIMKSVLKYLLIPLVANINIMN